MRLRILVTFAACVLALVGGRVALWLSAAGVANAAEPQELGRQDGHRAAIVFGAGLNADGSASPVLRDRVEAGARLLQRGDVDLLLLSGDNSRTQYSEPSAMREVALAAGAPAERIALDYGGRRSWDTCWRARNVFGIRRAVAVTSDFHRARVVALCRATGIEVDGAIGTPSDPYGGRWNWEVRELGASWLAVVDAWIRHPDVAVDGEPIDPYDRCSLARSLSPDDLRVTPELDDSCAAGQGRDRA